MQVSMQLEFQIKPLKYWASLSSPWACYKQADHEEEEDGRKTDGKGGVTLNIPSTYKKAFLSFKVCC